MFEKTNLRNALFGLAAIAVTCAPAAAEAGSGSGARNGQGTYRTLDLVQTGPALEEEFEDAHWRDREYRYGGHRRPGGWYGRNICRPGEAIRKAYRIGLRHPEIRRVSPEVIVVSGRNYGHWARVVFARWSPNCRIIGARGI